MAEAVVSILIDKLGNWALEKAQSHLEIQDDIAWLKGELSMMQAFLSDAERRSATDQALKQWLEQLQNLAFRIEDFLDLYSLHSKHTTQDSSSASSSSSVFDTIRSTVMKTLVSTGTSNLNWKQEMASEIANIKKEVEHIAKRMQTYCLHTTLGGEGAAGGSSSSSTRAVVMEQEEIRPHDAIVEEVDMVGFDEDLKLVDNWLLSDGEELSIMCIIGMGGSGKTALASRAYNLAHGGFDRHLWATAPDDITRLEDLIRSVLREQAYKRIHSGKRKNFVIVLDDVGDVSSCMDVIRSLQRNRVLPPNCRGRIILTSRNNISTDASLIRYDKDFHVHMVRPLSHDLAWDLFCRRAFPSHGVCPPYLNDLGREIVKRCSGLPLAIVLMGGLLSCNKYSNNPREWKGVLDHFDQELLHNPKLEGVNRIFQTSYNLLPSHLQYCFLYSCLFPKGSDIRVKKMIRLLVAQGFVKEQQGKTLEQVANYYILQLIERNMLEPIVSNFTGELVSYRAHDIVHELGVSSFKEGFGHFDETQMSTMIQKRYLAIHKEGGDAAANNENVMKARAVLVFANWAPVVSTLMFLRVLCVDGINILSLPDQLGDLYYLTYLGLRGTSIQYLPDSLGKLHNLETLDVRGTPIEILPTGITSIPKLRHLLLRSMKIHSPLGLVPISDSMRYALLLQTLSGVRAYGPLLEKLFCFTQLKKLYVSVTGQEEARTLFESINRIVDLCSLKIECRDSNGNYTEIMLGTLLPLPEYLEKLTLGGIIMDLPEWFIDLKSLRVLHLVNSMLVSDPLSSFSNLPNLVSFSLFHAYTGEQMGCGPDGYPKLRHLRITSLIELEEWSPIEEGTMPCLKFLSIIDCSKLRMLPQGFEQLKNLRSLEVIQMPEEFLTRLKMEDFYKVEHIPNIIGIPSNDLVQRTSQSSGGKTNMRDVDH